jgi:hypothetical protein
VRRAVVVGPYPPTADPAGAITLAEVRALRADGYDVLVISRERSAARVDASPRTRRGARRIARLVQGADLVLWVGAEPPPAVIERVLRDVGELRMRTTTTAPSAGPSPGVGDRLELLRAGAPTLLRSVGRRRA